MSSMFKAFENIVATHPWLGLGAEIALLGLGVLLLLLGLLAPKLQRHIGALSFALQLLLLPLLLLLCTLPVAGGNFSGLIQSSPITQSLRPLFIFIALLATHLGRVSLPEKHASRFEFYPLVLWVSAMSMLLVQADNWIFFFVSFETINIGLYLLIAFLASQTMALKASLKYILFSAVFSAFLLLGIALIYGAVGLITQNTIADPMSFAAAKSFVSANASHPFFVLGAFMVLIALGFKAGLVPFHFWAPDTYQGAPLPTSALFATASKMTAIIALAQLLTGPFEELKHFSLPLISVLAGLSVLIGNFSALTQRHLKRLFALSGVAHAGYLSIVLAAIILEAPLAQKALVGYLYLYTPAVFAAFLILGHLRRDAFGQLELWDFRQLHARSPFLFGVLVIAIASLAGIPPLAGFTGKFFVFAAAFQAELYLLLALALFGICISLAYYFNWMRMACKADASGANMEPVEFTCLEGAVLLLLVISLFVLGIFPGIVPGL